MNFSQNKRSESEQSLFNKFRNKFFIKKEKDINPTNKKGTKLIIKIIFDPFALWIYKQKMVLLNPFKLIYGHYYYDDLLEYKDIIIENDKILDKKSKIQKIKQKELYRNSSNQIVSHFNYDIMKKLVNNLNEENRKKYSGDDLNTDVNYDYDEEKALVDIHEDIQTKFDDNKKILEIL